MTEKLIVDQQRHPLLAQIARNPMYISILQIPHENIHPYFEAFLSRDTHVIDENYVNLTYLDLGDYFM